MRQDTSHSITGVSIDDVDVDETAAPDNTLEVTLQVDHGTLTLSDPSKVTFSLGDGTNDRTMTFMGSVADLNTAIHTITYSPDQSYHGTDNLNISADDQGHTGLGGPSLVVDRIVAITVKPASESGEYDQPHPNNPPDPTDPTDPTPALNFHIGPLGASAPLNAVTETIGALLFETFPSFNSIGEAGADEGNRSHKLGQFQTLLHKALFSQSLEANPPGSEHAWNDLFGWVSEKREEIEAETWLDLTEFLERLREWRVGKTLDDILLVFNAEEVKLTEWFNSVMAPPNYPLDNGAGTSAIHPDLSKESMGATCMVFDLEALCLEDILCQNVYENWPVSPAKNLSESNDSDCQLFDPGSISFWDILSG
jgi:hypothetical protein